MLAVCLSAVGFSVSWVVADRVGLDMQSALAFAAFVATLILTPLGFWASRTVPESPTPIVGDNPAAALNRPSADPARTHAQIVVGDLPGEAVAWQDRTDALDRLRVIAAAEQTAVVCAVTGQRGIGKTQLAAAYARRCVVDGWRVVVWIGAETVGGVLSGLDALAGSAGVRPPDVDPAEAALAGLGWLRVHPGPCLLVYDNAVD